MDQTLGVSSVERCADLADDPDRAFRLQVPALEQFVQILAADQPHIDVHISVDLASVVIGMTYGSSNVAAARDSR